jgi:hypothetical protein
MLDLGRQGLQSDLISSLSLAGRRWYGVARVSTCNLISSHLSLWLAKREEVRILDT